MMFVLRKRIHVTQNDINKGCAKDFKACPVARALQRAFPDYCPMIVGARNAWLVESYLADTYKPREGNYPRGSRGEYEVCLPKKVQDWIRLYDDANGVGSIIKPISFVVKLNAKLVKAFEF